MTSTPASPSTGHPSTLPLSHPLILELASLRQQLHQYQKTAHQSSIQLQGSRLELNLLAERYSALEAVSSGLRAEIDTLRSNPAPPPLQSQSTALTELSLAHRRLSAKLDLTESQLASTTLELANAQQEIQRLNKEKEGDRGVINDLRRIEEDREEEIEWERAERRKAEEQKKLCDLALQEYSTLVHSLDPSAVPPETPSTSTSSANILSSTPDLSESTSTPLTSPSSTSLGTSDTISNLLIGQKGVHRLFNDFTTTLTAKEKALHSAHAKIEQLELNLETLRKQLETETTLRVEAQNDREKALRDDGSAAKVVERYMIFTQKTHATVHMHLDNLRTRSNATQQSLRSELSGLRSQVDSEHARAEKLRGALDEMSEGIAREAAGRRREVALRLKMLTAEEKRERRIEKWLDKVRRATDGAEGAVVEPDILEALLEEGVEAVERERPEVGKPKFWRRISKRKTPAMPTADEREESIARVLLAEELVNTLVQDLQLETDRRMDLEKQRVEWLAKDALGGVAPAHDKDGDMMFEADVDDLPLPTKQADQPDQPGGSEKSLPPAPAPEKAPVSPPRTPSPLPETPPLLPQLHDLFDPLNERYTPLQKSLHDLSHSLESLRALPTSPKTAQRKAMINLSRRPDHTLTTLLDSIHEVIEDARVDVEIALADEERVFRGFEALLGVGKSGAVQGKEVIKDASDYVDDRKEWEGYSKLEQRIRDIESDLTGVKRVVHESEGLETGEESTKWSELELRTVSVPVRRPVIPVDTAQRKGSAILSNVGSVGRSFSSTIVGAPRRMGSFAGGLYNKPRDRNGEDVSLVNGKKADAEEDDVE